MDDVAMKVDEPATSAPIPAPSAGKPGDISPISGSMSGLPETGMSSVPPPAPAKRRPAAEPSMEILPNFSRVTPSQLVHITFPSGGRYQPVRPVATVPIAHSSSSKVGRLSTGKPVMSVSDRYAGGGGILLLVDRRPDESVELIDLDAEERAIPVEQGGQPQMNADNVEPGRSATFIDENAPEADPPQPFEVSVDATCRIYCPNHLNSSSTHLTMTRRCPANKYDNILLTSRYSNVSAFSGMLDVAACRHNVVSLLTRRQQEPFETTTPHYVRAIPTLLHSLDTCRKSFFILLYLGYIFTMTTKTFMPLLLSYRRAGDMKYILFRS